MKRYVGAIDQGTTSTRFIVFDRVGAIVASAQKEHRQIFPQPGWVEHDPEEIFRAACEVVTEALGGADLRPSDLAAVGVANQRETALIWERGTGRPLHNAIVWMDARTESLVAETARDGGADRFRAQTGLPLSTYFSALKWRWLLDHLPEGRRRAEAGDVMFGAITHPLFLSGGLAIFGVFKPKWRG
jgi:glycerol kinase